MFLKLVILHLLLKLIDSFQYQDQVSYEDYENYNYQNQNDNDYHQPRQDEYSEENNYITNGEKT